jgi:hypothetical protein
MLEAFSKALLGHRSDDLSVKDEGCGGIGMVEVEAQDRSHKSSPLKLLAVKTAMRVTNITTLRDIVVNNKTYHFSDLLRNATHLHARDRIGGYGVARGGAFGKSLVSGDGKIVMRRSLVGYVGIIIVCCMTTTGILAGGDRREDM